MRFRNMNEHSPARGARIKDVARIAGVSTATVSRTLSNPDIVSEDTRRAVLAAVDETGYSVNLSARHLRQQRTGGILALAPNLANPFFSEILSGISDVLREAGLNLIVGDTSINDDARMRLVDYANRSRCDGLIVLDGSLDPEVFTRSQCPPVVQACEWITGLAAPRVFADNEAGAELVVDHLCGLGHRRIGRVSGPPSNSLTRSRDALVALFANRQDRHTGRCIPLVGIVGPFRFHRDRGVIARIFTVTVQLDIRGVAEYPFNRTTRILAAALVIAIDIGDHKRVCITSKIAVDGHRVSRGDVETSLSARIIIAF